MASRMVSGLRKLGARVASNTSDRTRNQRTVQGLIERCSDVVPEGTTTLTLDEAQFYLGQQIRFEAEALRLQDDVHEGALVQVHFDRLTKNDSYEELRATMLRTRQGYEIIHGKGSGARLMGSSNEIPDDPTRLHQMAARCLNWLRDPEWLLPESPGGGLRFDREASAAEIEGPLNRLETAIAAIPEELRGSIDTLVSKQGALERFQKLVGQGARFLEALYDIGGLEGESDRIRQSSHRSSGPLEPPAETEETAGPEPEPAPAPASPPPSQDSSSGEPASDAGPA